MGKIGRLGVIGIVMVLIVGCKTMKIVEQVPVELHDTLYRNVVQHDSTYVDRWHTVYQKDDTVFVTNTEVRYRERIKTDTAYKVIERPITVTQTEIKEVEKPLGWWQKLFIGIGILGTLGLIGVVLVWQWRKRH